MAKKILAKNESIPHAQPVTPQERGHCIAVAAYYHALQRGFAEGDPVADWLQAEQEIDTGLLNPMRPSAESVSREQLPEKPAATSQSNNPRS